MEGVISQLGLDSFGGAMSFVLTVASLALPILWKMRKKEKVQKKIPMGNYVVIANSSKWRIAPAKVLRFGFTDKKVAVVKNRVKEIVAHGPSPLVAFVEYKDANDNIVTAPLFVGEKEDIEGEIVTIKYNLLDKQQIILA